MIILKEEYPFNDDTNLIYHYAEDEAGIQYKILQKETNIIYDSAVDIYPCRYTYQITQYPVEVYSEEPFLQKLIDEENIKMSEERKEENTEE